MREYYISLRPVVMILFIFKSFNNNQNQLMLINWYLATYFLQLATAKWLLDAILPDLSMLKNMNSYLWGSMCFKRWSQQWLPVWYVQGTVWVNLWDLLLEHMKQRYVRCKAVSIRQNASTLRTLRTNQRYQQLPGIFKHCCLRTLSIITSVKHDLHLWNLKFRNDLTGIIPFPGGWSPAKVVWT